MVGAWVVVVVGAWVVVVVGARVVVVVGSPVVVVGALVVVVVGALVVVVAGSLVAVGALAVVGLVVGVLRGVRGRVVAGRAVMQVVMAARRRPGRAAHRQGVDESSQRDCQDEPTREGATSLNR